MPDTPAYVHLVPGKPVSVLSSPFPFRAVVVVDDQVTSDWQSLVSDWLVQSGCLYMMAWGFNCSSWDDSVDLSNLKIFGCGEIPDDQFVMTTWHSDKSLSEVFWFAKNTAFHPTIELEQTVIVHISTEPAADKMLRAYDEA